MDEDDNPDFAPCDECQGSFYKGDLIDGAYCGDCFDELFDEEEGD